MGDKDMALPASQDRAVVNGAASVSALRASVPSADEFAGFVASVLAECPEYLDRALAAISAGMSSALQRAEERAALKDRATLAAMALVGGRVGKELRETLLARVVAGIHPSNQCGYERGYIDTYAQAIEARRAETGTGSVACDESAVGDSRCAHNPAPHDNGSHSEQGK